MKFKLDENVTSDGLIELSAAGFDAMTVGNQGMSGWEDAAIRSTCLAEGRIIITADLDLTDIRDLPAGAPGIVVLRLPRQSRLRQAEAIRRFAVAVVGGLEITGRIAIVEPSRIRIRGR